MHTVDMRDVQRLPQAVLSAELLNGTLRRLGHGTVALLDASSLEARARSVFHEVYPGIVFSGRTAAWIWGVYRTFPSIREYSVRSTARTSVPLLFTTIRREVTLSTDDVRNIGPFEITTPLRTAEDILRSLRYLSTEDAVACRLLLLQSSHSREQFERVVAERNRAPHTRRLRSHLQKLYGND